MIGLVQAYFPEYSSWADILSLVGFFVTIIGFVFTSFKISAAQKEIKEGIAKSEVISDLTFSISKIDEIRRLQRVKSWETLPERYSELRRSLSSLRSSGVKFDDDEELDMQKAVVHFSSMERSIEEALENNTPVKNIPKVNQLLSNQSDNLHKILVRMKKRIK